ncbi:MAG: hypothetical protein QM756_14325 [Polyangiaceae bacterium]
MPYLFNFASSDDEAWVIRPRVAPGTAYTDYLRGIGALPAGV